MPSTARVACGIALVIFGASCSRSRRPAAAVAGTSEFTASAPVALDQPLRVTFAAPIDAATLTDDAVLLVATDGPGVGTPTRGTWRAAGAAIEFVPALALAEPVATGGGLQPGTRYELRVRGGEQPGALRAVGGRAVAPAAFAFVTRTGSTPAELFAHDAPGGPRLVSVEVAPRDDAGTWQLGRAFVPAAMRLVFDQPLDPGGSNLPPVAAAAVPGPWRLTYDDPVYGADTVVDVTAELIHNDTEGAVVVLTPRGVLPSHANVRLTVAPTLRDLFGADNAGAFVEPPRTFTTEADAVPRHDALVFDFADTVPLAAADFAEVPAIVADGALRVPAAFPAVAAEVGDWTPSGAETVLRTDQQQLVYQNGVVRQFAGGVLHVRDLHVPAGHVVRGVGPNPLVLVVDGDARIDGTLSVDGADATVGSAAAWSYRGPGDVPLTALVDAAPVEAPAVAMAGPAGGYGGGVATWATSTTSVAGGTAPGVADGGGQGGIATCGPERIASGGGGGGGAVQGDPWYPTPIGSSSPFPQRSGFGGSAGGSAPPGGAPGSAWFANGDAGDDFWGRAYVPHRRRMVTGELDAPRGGSGGGSGGSWNVQTLCPPAGGFYLPGGGGGGGGGVLVLQVRGRLTIGPMGRVSADGGDGLGGNAFQFATRGSGGGGAGGTVVLMAGGGIELHVRGATFAERDYDFCVSADGGISVTRSTQVTPTVASKYPANGSAPISGELYGQNPLGGFGGMGLVQFQVPVGSDNADGTNTVLDDAIDVVRDGVLLNGFDKQRYLGWRGFPDDAGVLVDDFGLPTGTIGGQGDIRPDPVLLPLPWAGDGAARARSEWLSLGALHRRAVTAPDGLPRGVVGIATTFGAHARSDGWLPHGEGRLAPGASGVARLLAPATIAEVAVDDGTFGRRAFALVLTADLPETAAGAYTGCIAELAPAVGGSWTQRRVLHSTARTLFVDGALPLPDGMTRVQVFGWYAALATPEPDSYVGADGALPRANARIGFAFHRVPATALHVGVDPDRYPPVVGTFLYDLTEPAVATALRAFGPRAVQWDVRLDGAWRATPDDQPPAAGPGSAIALRRFFLPVRF